MDTLTYRIIKTENRINELKNHDCKRSADRGCITCEEISNLKEEQHRLLKLKKSGMKLKTMKLNEGIKGWKLWVKLTLQAMGWVLVAYVIVFGLWAVLSLSCITEQTTFKRDVEVCGDNSLTTFVRWAYSPVINLVK